MTRHIYTTEWLRFEQVKDTGKTFAWQVTDKEETALLGLVSWHGPWRKYVFMSGDRVIFDADCLQSVQEFLRARMDEWRANKVRTKR